MGGKLTFPLKKILYCDLMKFIFGLDFSNQVDFYYAVVLYPFTRYSKSER